MVRSLLLTSALTFLFTAASSHSSAQGVVLFDADSRKLFATLDHAPTYSLAFDSAVVSGDTTAYYNFKGVRDTLLPSNCFWWGDPACAPMDRPTWAGGRIDAAANGTHVFHNVFGQDLRFDFLTDPGSETVIYSDAEQQFILHHEGSGFYTVLGQVEAVSQWSILHLDEFGAVINSPLNNAEVSVGATLGLLRFFRVDSFPLVLEPLELVGQSEPPLGFHQITPAVLHDYQPGDEVQWHYYANYTVGPPWLDYNYYSKYKILQRTDLPTAVEYVIERSDLNLDSALLNVDTITNSYSTTVAFAAIPFERFDGTQPSLGKEVYCGIPLWTYRTYLNQGLGYCPEENCWGPTDTNGPPAIGGTTFVAGLGIFSSTESVWSPTGYGIGSQIVYFKKNGVECFNEVILSVADASKEDFDLQFGPNPCQDQLRFASKLRVSTLEVMDLNGRTLLVHRSASTDGSLDLRAVPAGMHALRFTFANGDVAVRRIVKQ